ncbi:MAG: hypothetical protein H8E62_00165 [Planctomycetes bacterium]|nr:hypothetical protein [Planctomycetota bacterium]
MIDWIARDIGVTTLRYQTIEDMVEAIGLPKEKLCLYCWTGRCPKACSKNSKSRIRDIKPTGAKKHEEELESQHKLW